MRTLIIFLMLVFITMLSAQTFDESLLQITKDIAAKLKSPTTDCIALVWIHTTNPQNKTATAYPELEDYAIQQIYDDFTGNLKVDMIEPFNTKKTVNDKFAGFPLPTTYVKFQSLCEHLFYLTNQTVSVVISGSIVPDGNNLKTSFTLYDPATAQAIGTVTKKIPADDISDGLIGVVRKKAEKPKEDMPAEVAIKDTKPVIEKKVIEEAPELIQNASDIIWQEDFSGYSEGDALTAWGSDAVVVPGLEGKKYLSSEKKGDNIARKKIQLPKNFVMRFSFVGYNFDADLIFADADAREYKISFNNIWNGCWINLPGNKGTNIPSRPINAIRIEKVDTAIKLFINGEFTQAGVTDRLDAITSFALYFPESVKFTDFSIAKK